MKEAVIILSKKTRIVVSSVLLLMTILVCSRCDYSTKVISSAEPPDKTFHSFAAALKEKNFYKADSFLANGATIHPKNETGYGFFDDYVDAALTAFSCEKVGEPVYDGSSASLEVTLVSFDRDAFLSWTEKNLLRLEHDYLLKNELKEFDNGDKKAVDAVMSMALKEYAEKDKGVSRDVTVKFVFASKSWRISADEDLIKAIFGGNENEGKDTEGKEKSDGNDQSGDSEKPEK